jgi:predicted GTPase
MGISRIMALIQSLPQSFSEIHMNKFRPYILQLQSFQDYKQSINDVEKIVLEMLNGISNVGCADTFFNQIFSEIVLELISYKREAGEEATELEDFFNKLSVTGTVESDVIMSD